MANETLIIDLQSDASGLQPTIDLLIKLGLVDEKAGAIFKKTSSDIKAQGVALKGVGDEAKKAGDKITGAAKGASNDLGKLSGTIKNIGASIGIGLGTAAIVAFGKESFKAFTDAEKVAKVLQTAVGVNGGLQADYEKLLEQSKELQKISIFSDEDIRRAQTLALQFGLTNDQVENLIPTIIDFASATGQNLQSALEAVLRGTEGMARGLKIYGVEVDSTGTKSQKLAQITDQLNEKFIGQAKIVGETTFGAVERLKNQFNDLQEEVGEFVAGAGESTAAIIAWITNGFQPLQDEIDETTGKLDELGKKILGSLPKALIEQQIAQFKALGQAIPQQLIDQLKQFNFDEFNEEVESLNDKELIKKLDDIQKETVKFLKAGDLTKGERLKIINDEIAARKTQGKLLQEQNQVDLDDTLKALAKEGEERRKAQEALRKFTLEELLKNVDEKAAIQRQAAALEIKDNEDLQGRLTIIEFDALRERIAIKKEFAESTLDEDQKIADILIKNAQDVNRAIEEQMQKGLEARLKTNKSVKDSIEDLAEIEGDLSKKTIGELILLMKIAREVGLKGVKDFDAAQDELENRIERFLSTLVSIASEVSGIFANFDQARLDSLDELRNRQQEAFDEESEALREKVDRDLITQAEYENGLKALKKQREADDKRIAAEERKIKREQAAREKEFNAFQALINGASAVVEALPNIPLSLLVGGLAALQLGRILTAPPPKFHTGRLAKADSSEEHAIVRKDETILSPETSKQYRETLTAIHNRKVPASLINSFVRMKLDNMPQFKERSITFPEMLDCTGVKRGMKDALSEGVKIKNTKQLASDIVDIMPKENPYHRV